ncbi:hypothetical protein ES703_96304 [subsurface metagenome]
MVLITNKTGETKAGRQGEAVYQGHYGRQMRRTAKPKTTEPTTKQTQRRSLFRQALAWRAGLNRHDRLVLHQAAYEYHYTDGEGIILTWDKLALKIALEVPKIRVLNQ